MIRPPDHDNQILSLHYLKKQQLTKKKSSNLKIKIIP